MVFAARIAEDMKALAVPQAKRTAVSLGKMTSSDEFDGRMELRKTMSAQVGVLRNGKGLTDAIADIDRISKSATTSTLQNMCVSAQLVATAAWQRHESRGGHFREDFPQADMLSQKRSYCTLSQSSQTAFEALQR